MPQLAEQPVEAFVPGLVNPSIVDAAAQIRRRFAAAAPFRHVCIDNFLLQEAARRLADGEDAECARRLASPQFAALIEQLTGERGLVAAATPGASGPGLKVIIFLDRASADESIEIVPEPDSPVRASVAPVFNRAIIHDIAEVTTDSLPAARHVAVCLVPQGGAGADGPLPGGDVVPFPGPLAAFAATEYADPAILREAVGQASRLARVYNQRLAELRGELAEARRSLMATPRIRILGYAEDAGGNSGVYHDGWVAPEARVTIRCRRPVSRVVIRVWVDARLPAGGRLTAMAGAARVDVGLDSGDVQFALDLPQPAADTLELFLAADRAMPPMGVDRRPICFVLREIEVVHADDGSDGYALAQMQQLAALQGELVGVQRDLLTARQQAATDAGERGALREILTARDGELQQAVERAEHRTAERDAAQQAGAGLRDLLASRDAELQLAAERAERDAAEHRAVEEALSALRDALASRDAELHEATARFEQGAAELADLGTQLAERGKTVARLEAELAETAKRAAAQAAEHGALLDMLEEYDLALTEAGRAESRSASELSSFEALLEEYDCALDEAQRSVSANAAAIAAGKAQIAHLREAIELRDAALAQVTERAEEGDARVIEMQAALAAAAERTAEHEAALAQLRRDLVSLETELGLRRSLSGAREAAVAEVTRELSVARAEIQALTARFVAGGPTPGAIVGFVERPQPSAAVHC